MSVSDGNLNDRWDADAPIERDWKKLFLIIGLGILSWVATYVGMLELIEANLGELPIVHKLIIAGAVAMLMTMIIWLLDQMFAPIPAFTKLVYVAGYIFLSAISVGFGFGFYWKVLESRSETTRSAAGAVTQVQGALVGASARLDQLQSTLDNLTTVSRQKATIEQDRGTSCPNSRPGDGPRRQLRNDDAEQFSFASQFVSGRAAQLKTELKDLDGSLALITKADAKTKDASGTRNEFMRTLGGKLDSTVARYNAFRSDPQLRQIRTNFAERADRTMFKAPSGVTFSCPDPQLQMALGGVVRAIDQLPVVNKPQINSVEGSEATIEAFRRLGATFYGALSLKLPPSADELRDKQKQAVLSLQKNPEASTRPLENEQSGLSGRDYIPLAIAAFVDICLLLVAMGRPMNHLGGLVPTMRAAEQGPMYHILSKFSEIHKNPEVREKFEVFRHVVFDFNGDYYVAVPLDAPYRPGRYERDRYGADRIEDLQQEAHLLANFFASFEKKRIFTRVYSPFLTTKAIQKRLQRQGSKFASSQAFRVYRFRDGAWSEIILNTIMRAAREVEITKRRTAREAGPSLDVPATGPATGNPPQPMPGAVRPGTVELPCLDESESLRPRAAPRYGIARPRKMQPADYAEVEVRSAQFGKYARAATRELDDDDEPAGRPAVRSAPGAANANGTPARLRSYSEDRGDTAYRGEDDNIVPFDPSKSGNTSRLTVAGRDSDPLPRMFAASQSALAQRSEPSAATIDVVVTEREARFTVPATDAILPPGLRNALAAPAERPASAEQPRENDHQVIDAIALAVASDEPGEGEQNGTT